MENIETITTNNGLKSHIKDLGKVYLATKRYEDKYEQRRYEVGYNIERLVEATGLKIRYDEKRRMEYRTLMKEFGPLKVLKSEGGIKANDLFRLAAEEFSEALCSECLKDLTIRVIHVNMGSCHCGNYNVHLGIKGYKFYSNLEEKAVGVGSLIPCWGYITEEWDQKFHEWLKEDRYRVYRAIMSVHSGGRITKFVADTMSPFCRLEEEPEKALKESSQEPWKTHRGHDAWSKEEFEAINDFMEKSKNA